VTESKTGKIIFTQIGKIPATGETYGIITIRTSENEKIELKINDATEFQNLKMGSDVTVAFEESDDSRFPIATEVKIN